MNDINILVNGECNFGYNDEIITPSNILKDKELALAGHSVAGQIANHLNDHLYIKTLYVEDRNGEVAVFCFMDLLSGSELLLDAVHEAIPDLYGRVMLVGTHTHYGPGNFFGNRFYDNFAQTNKKHGNKYQGHANCELVDWLTSKIIKSILAAEQDMESGHLVVVESEKFDIGANRSIDAFQENPEAKGWFEYAPANTDKLNAAIDPKITSIVGIRKGGRGFVAFSTMALHPTCMGPKQEGYSADWPGIASANINHHFNGCIGCAFALSAAGDVSPITPERLKIGGRRKSGQGDKLRKERGKQVSDHMIKVLNLVIPVEQYDPTPLTIKTKFAYWNPQKKLGRPKVGLSLLAGAEDGGGIDGIDEGKTSRARDKNQHPKWIVGGKIQNRKLFTIAPLHPVSQFIFSSNEGMINHTFIAVPCEITTIAGFRLIDKVRKNQPFDAWWELSDTASIISNVNDYMGYITTEEEYELQHYEGGHTLFGRNSLKELIKAHKKLT